MGCVSSLSMAGAVLAAWFGAAGNWFPVWILIPSVLGLDVAWGVHEYIRLRRALIESAIANRFLFGSMVISGCAFGFFFGIFKVGRWIF